MARRIKKLLPVGTYDFHSMEMYFSEMSSKGLHFSEIKGGYVYFDKAQEINFRYEIIPIDTKKLWPDAEMTAYFTSCGWDIIDKLYGKYAVLRTEKPDAVKPYTDEVSVEIATEDIVRRIKKNAVFDIAVPALILAVCAFITYIKPMSVIQIVKKGNLILYFLLLCPATMAGAIIKTSVRIGKVRLWASEDISREIRYVPLWKIYLKKFMSFVTAVFFWLLIYSPSAEGYYRQIDNVTYPVPLVSAYDIIPDGDFVADNEEQKWGNGSYSVQIQKSVFGEEYKFYQRGYVLSETEKDPLRRFGDLQFVYEVYDMRTEKLADTLWDDVVKEYRERSLDITEEISDGRFDKFLYLANGDEQYFIAGKGNVIMSGKLWVNTVSGDSYLKYPLTGYLDLIHNALTYERK
ncbi:MAG: DUF2812 domain-containing protein [Eubacteriaceae bacterium]|nr:DUF2812 domain-containing protein [Eubacteriaceae bacterium]